MEHRESLVAPTQPPAIPERAPTVFDNNGSFLLAMFELFIFFAWFMCLWWVFGDIFRSKDLGGGAKTLWVLFIIILPILGMLVFLLVRGPGMNQRAAQEMQERQQMQAEYIRSVTASSGASSGAGSGVTDQITQAKALLDSGAINQQ